MKMSGDVDGEVAGMARVEGSLQLRLGGEEEVVREVQSELLWRRGRYSMGLGGWLVSYEGMRVFTKHLPWVRVRGVWRVLRPAPGHLLTLTLTSMEGGLAQCTLQAGPVTLGVEVRGVRGPSWPGQRLVAR